MLSELTLVAKAGKMLGGEHGRAKKVGAAIVGTALVLGLADRCGSIAGLEEHTTVTAAKKAELKLATTIPEETVVARAVAHYGGIKSASHVDACVNVPVIGKRCTPHLASWSESYTGDIGAKIATTKSVQAAEKFDPNAQRRDGKKGALVVKLSEADFALDVYEMQPSKGFKSDNSPGGAFVSNLMNDIKAIPGLDAGWIDNKYNALRNLDINEAFREMAVPQGCGHLAIDKLTHPGDVDADAALEQPKTIQGLIIRNLVSEGNNALALAHDTHKLTSLDFNVDIAPASVTIPTQYTQFNDVLHAHPPKNVTIPNEASIHQCQDVTGMAGGR